MVRIGSSAVSGLRARDIFVNEIAGIQRFRRHFRPIVAIAMCAGFTCQRGKAGQRQLAVRLRMGIGFVHRLQQFRDACAVGMSGTRTGSELVHWPTISAMPS